jgi:hypothetical protein
VANNRIPVFLPLSKSLPEFPIVPPHRTSPKFAALLVNTHWAKYVALSNVKLGIVLCCALSWAAVKEQFRTGLRPIPKLLPPRGPESLLLQYPLVGQETDAAERRALLWTNATRF